MAWGLLQLPGNDRELSVYATEAYYAGPGSRVRRFTFRTDGFVSVHAAGGGHAAHQTADVRRIEALAEHRQPGTHAGRIAGRRRQTLARLHARLTARPSSATTSSRRCPGKTPLLAALAGQPVRLRFELQGRGPVLAAVPIAAWTTPSPRYSGGELGEEARRQVPGRFRLGFQPHPATARADSIRLTRTVTSASDPGVAAEVIAWSRCRQPRIRRSAVRSASRMLCRLGWCHRWAQTADGRAVMPLRSATSAS